jgi:hypothetical protein
MPEIKEFREFFLRATKVTSGSRPDKEIPFPVQYVVNGSSKYNRFLKDHAPSEKVFKKLFESLTFKLNSDDSATEAQQGLVRFATDLEATNADSAANSAGFYGVLRPNQVAKYLNTSATTTTTVSGKTISWYAGGGIIKRVDDVEVAGLTGGISVEFVPESPFEFNNVELPIDGCRLKFRFIIHHPNTGTPGDTLRLVTTGGTVTGSTVDCTANSGAAANFIYDGEIIRLTATTFIINGTIENYESTGLISTNYFYHAVTTPDSIDTVGVIKLVPGQSTAVVPAFLLRHSTFTRMVIG